MCPNAPAYADSRFHLARPHKRRMVAKPFPPLVRQNTGLTPIDYFGRTMIVNLPDNIRVGVVPVAIGGANIKHLDKDFDSATIANEAEWYKSFMAAYDNAPYKRLVECARIAQQQGVIKGILLHQGETNNGYREWPAYVKKYTMTSSPTSVFRPSTFLCLPVKLSQASKEAYAAE